MFLYLSNTKSPYRFNVMIPDGVDISGEIGLAEIYFEFKESEELFDVCCDICENSMVDRNEYSDERPVLRRIHAFKRKGYIQFDPIHYIPVIRPKPHIIEIYLRPVHFKSPSVDLKSLNCTLHCKP